MDWSKLPDLVAVGLLALAFASVARQSYTPVSAHWLTGWLLIVVHFAAFMFAGFAGGWGTFAEAIGILALVLAALLFIRAAIPFRNEGSSRWMFAVLVIVYTVYVCCLMYGASPTTLNAAAILLGGGPLATALIALRHFTHPLRWVTITLTFALAAVCLAIQNRPGGNDLALNAVLFAVYFGCCIHAWYMYRRGTAGAVITVAGFLTWSSVFVVGPLMDAYFPGVHVENEVWNLPKYVVAVGMILLLLEDQIAHNKHLALHDELTGLPNRRLFQDRLASAVERARRTNTQTALLMLDLDQFKQVNDTLGHHAGDLLLQKVSELFGTRVRRSDTVARTGGDEFAVVLESPTSSGEASGVGRSLLELLKDPIMIEEHAVSVGASVGIAIFPDDAQTIDSLCILADTRMYQDKRGDDINPGAKKGVRLSSHKANSTKADYGVSR